MMIPHVMCSASSLSSSFERAFLSSTFLHSHFLLHQRIEKARSRWWRENGLAPYDESGAVGEDEDWRNEDLTAKLGGLNRRAGNNMLWSDALDVSEREEIRSVRIDLLYRFPFNTASTQASLLSRAIGYLGK